MNRNTALALLGEIERLRRDRAYVKENAEFLRSSVGECHLMISRNSSEFQTQGEQWRLSDLPARLQRIMRERETLAAAVMAQRERTAHIAECDRWRYDRWPAGGQLPYRAKRVLDSALALLGGEKGGAGGWASSFGAARRPRRRMSCRGRSRGWQ